MISVNMMILLGVSIFIIILGMFVLISAIKKTDKKEKLREIIQQDQYDGFVSNSDLVIKLSKSKIINKLGNNTPENNSKLEKIFNDAKNPWGITPTIFRAIRLIVIVLGVVIGLVLLALTKKQYGLAFGLGLSVIGWYYPTYYYYKQIAKERQLEWNKIYEFIWLIKHTSVLFDAKKVCFEAKKYIEIHYPQYTEIIGGLSDFNKYWEDDKIPDYILKYYNFSIPKELYSILFNMNLTGTSAHQNLNNLRVFALNKHNDTIQETLTNVPGTATLSTLPFLMVSVIIALLVPMIVNFMTLM